MVDHIAAVQLETTQAQRKSIGQVAGQQKRGQREDERNAKRRAGSSGKMPSARGRRAPKSASQFHFTKKYSNRSGKNRAPSSALKKLAYDHRLTLIDDQGREVPPGKHSHDLDYSYVSFAPGTPVDALDLSKLGQEAERSAGRQSNSRQMSHYDISLPADLSADARRELVRKICDGTRARMDGIPVFAAVHRPDGHNGNWHVHISHPLRQIIAVDDTGAFRMGDRIMHEQRPGLREAAGLPKTNRDELKAHRAATASLIGDSLESEGHDPQLAERWRHGHLRLADQVDKAAERGDVQFVIDNHSRSATKHEGPGAHHGKIKSTASEHNADTGIVDAAILTRSMINSLLETAGRLQIRQPEHLRMLSHDMGLLLHWSKDRESGNIQGLQWQIVGGPKLSGAVAGCSLGNLKRRMQWTETPEYAHTINRHGEVFEAYKAILDKHGKGKFAGRGVSILDRVINAQLQEKEAAIAAAADAQPKEEVGTQTEPRQRPKRASSKDRSKDSLNPRNPTPKEPPVTDAAFAFVNSMLADLARLPDDEEPPEAQQHQANYAAAQVHQVPSPPPAKLLQPPTQAQIDELNESERQFLRDRYDYRVGAGDFKSPARDAQEMVEQLWLALQKINDTEPTDYDYRFVEVRRLFRKSTIVESPQLIQWREQRDQAREAYQTAYKKAAANFSRLYRDPELWAGLPAFRAEQSAQVERMAQAKREEAERLEKAFRERNRAYRTGERQDDSHRDRDRGG